MRLTPAEKKARREARDRARASRPRLDTFIRILLLNPNWTGGAIVPRKGAK